MGSSVALPEGDRHLGYGGFAVGVEQLRSVRDDGAVLLLRSAEEAGHVHEGHEGDVECVAEAHEACGLAGGVDVEHTGEDARLVRDYSDAPAAHVGEAYDDVLREVLVNLEEVAVIDDAADDSVHVVRLVGVVGYDLVEGVVGPGDGVCGRALGRAFKIVLGQVAQELLDLFDSLLLGRGAEMCHSGFRGVHRGASELLLVHDLSCH